MASIVATFAQLERRLIGERVREALAAKRAAGARLGRPRQLSNDVVETIVTRRTDGASLRAIAEALNEAKIATAHGGARWHASTVRAVLASAER
jgi:DNA invertase Pin-like site-specific DNA recombinase